MKLLVFSDSHNNRKLIDRAIGDNPDAGWIIHAGDGAYDIEDNDAPRIRKVAGNCDIGFEHLPAELVFEAGGVKFFLAHGNNHKVSYGTDRFRAAAKAAGCGIAIYGHTHRSRISYDGEIFILNPGTANRRKAYDGYASYAVITVEEEKIKDISIIYY